MGVNHKIITTKDFLIKRGMNLAANCAWCNNGTEDMDHLFWKCSLATTAWSILSSWLGIKYISLPNDKFEINHILSLRKEYEGWGIHWTIFIAATVWSIWSSRNLCIFQNKKRSTGEIEFMIKSSAYCWMKAKGWFQEASLGLDNIWSHSLLTYIKIQAVNRRDSLLQILFSKFDLVAFSDGAWSSSCKGISKGGLGGLLYNKKKEIILIISGPSTVDSACHAEINACNMLMNKISKSSFKNANIVICTDSRWVV